MTLKSTNVCLAEIPKGLPTQKTFAFETVDVPDPKDGEVTVKNLYMSVDPYMRGRMTGIKTYADPFKVGEVMGGGAVGEVVASEHPDFKTGDHVMSMRGWRTAYTASVDAMKPEGFRKIDTSMIPPQAYLGIAGMPGLTAYAGLYDVAKFQPGETVLVSGAAGAVGSVVCQLAKADGGKVIALAGSDEKCEWLESRGIDSAINYKKNENLTKSILKAAPDGVDVYYENVGGDMLEAALNTLKQHGRIAACGMIAYYNDAEPQPGPTNMTMIVGKSLKIQGFIVTNHAHLVTDYIAKLGPLLASGKVVAQETIVDGIENSPEAFLRLFDGNKQGKMLVKLA